MLLTAKLLHKAQLCSTVLCKEWALPSKAWILWRSASIRSEWTQSLYSRGQWECTFIPFPFMQAMFWRCLSPPQTLAVSSLLGLGTCFRYDTFVLKSSLWSSFQQTTSKWCCPEVCGVSSSSPQWLQGKWCCCLEGAVQGAAPRGSPPAHFAADPCCTPWAFFLSLLCASSWRHYFKC